MHIAKHKRQENIAEYILYIWQLEDLIRALEFSPDNIYLTLIAPHTELDNVTADYTLNWYMELADLLRREGKQERGHLDHTTHLIAELDELHQHLLVAPIGAKYAKTFAPLAAELHKLGEGSDMERCFRALYSVMLCRMKGTENPNHIKDVLELVSPVVAQLTAIFHKVERGEIDPYEGMEQ